MRGEPDTRRNHAIRALANLVDDDANAQTVWTPECASVHGVLTAAAAPAEPNEWAQAYAIRALSACPLSDRQFSDYQADVTNRVLRPRHLRFTEPTSPAAAAAATE